VLVYSHAFPQRQAVSYKQTEYQLHPLSARNICSLLLLFPSKSYNPNLFISNGKSRFSHSQHYNTKHEDINVCVNSSLLHLHNDNMTSLPPSLSPTHLKNSLIINFSLKSVKEEAPPKEIHLNQLLCQIPARH
jgi:hypothetical protein